MSEALYESAKKFSDRLKKIYSLKNVIRYNTKNVLYKENVAEHCFNVAMIALSLCDNFGIEDPSIREQCLTKALLHDMPETVYNDITHDVKEKLHLRPLLKEHEDQYYTEEFPKQAVLMNNRWPIVDEVVDYADVLSVKQYIANERALGNKSSDLDPIEAELEARLSSARDKMIAAIKEENSGNVAPWLQGH